MTEDKKVSQQDQPITYKYTIDPVDQVYIIDLIQVLVRQKIVIFCVFALVLIVGISYIFFAKPVFSSYAYIQIGKIDATDKLERRDELVFRLKYKHIKGKQSNDLPVITSVIGDKKGPNNVVILKAEAYSYAEAANYVMSVVNDLILEHKKLYDEYMMKISSEEYKLNLLKEKLEEQVGHIDSMIRTTKKQDAYQASLLTIEKSQLLLRIVELDLDIYNSDTAYKKIISKPTHALFPSQNMKRIKPDSKLVIVITIVLGLTMGFIVAVITEFIQNRNITISPPKRMS